MSRLCGRRGFTLIELLVVIAIIAILAAILFPIFITAQQRARTGKCMAHAKELGSALSMYLSDWGERLPFVQFLTYRSWPNGHPMYPQLKVIRLYQPYVKNFDITLCTERGRMVNADTGKYETARMAYAYNQCLCGPLAKRIAVQGPADVMFIDENTGWVGRPLGNVKWAAKTPTFFCARPLRNAPGNLGPNGYGWDPTDINNSDRMRNPHAGGTNYAFLDGHVKWLIPAGGTFYMATDGIDYDGNGTIGDAKTMR